MKKIFKNCLLLLSMFIMAGCSKSVESSNNIEVDYHEVNNNSDIIYNLKESLKQVKSFSFSLDILVNGKKHVIDGKIINRGTIENSVIRLDYLDNTLILNDKNIYISYKYNNYDVSIKDSLDNFIEETISSLEKKGIKCERDKIYSIIRDNTLSDVYLEWLSEFVVLSGDEYALNYENLNISLNEFYLPKEINLNNDHIVVIGNINYDTVSITIPSKYEMFSLSLKNVKSMLKVESISDLIKLK